jgi:hypothetical protein
MVPASDSPMIEMPQSCRLDISAARVSVVRSHTHVQCHRIEPAFIVGNAAERSETKAGISTLKVRT